MAINFPNSPSVNDIHVDGANRWQWNGSSWTRIGGASSDSDIINSTNDNSTTTLYPVMVSGTGNQTAKIATSATKNLKFDASEGDLTVGGNISVGGTATFTGSVSVGGTITYEDVRNVDSIGIVTARAGVIVTGNVDTDTLNVSGISTVTGGIKVGTAGTICEAGNMTFDKPGAGIITATRFVGSGVSLTDVISGVGIRTAGGTVGWAATIIDFRGPGVTTAYYSSVTGVGTVHFTGGGGGASVSISESAPNSPGAGDLWWDSDVGNLQIYYTDANSSQWVTANNAGPQGPQGAQGATGAQGHQGVQGAAGAQGAQGRQGAQGVQGAQGHQGRQGSVGIASLTISQTPPSSPAQGDMWWDSDDSTLGLYYNDGNSSQWVNINHGPSGPQGAAGAQGAQGAQGVQGAAGTNANADFIIEGNTKAEVVDTGSDGHFKVETEGSERLRILSDGKIGIGVAAPGELLHLKTASGNCKIRIDAAATPSLDFYEAGTRNSDIMVDYSSNDLIVTNRQNANIIFRTNGTNERLRIDSSGRLLVGTTASRAVNSAQGSFQIEGTGAEDSDMSIVRNQNNSGGPAICFGKSRSGSLAGNTVVQSGDQFGSLIFMGNDGTDLASQGARIDAVCDGTPGSNDMPGRLTFSTTADGATSATERLRITSGGKVNIGGDYTNTTSTLRVLGDSNAGSQVYLEKNSGSTNNTYHTALTISARSTGSAAANYGPAINFQHSFGSSNYAGSMITSQCNADVNTADLVFYSRNYGYKETLRITSGSVARFYSPDGNSKGYIYQTNSDNFIVEADANDNIDGDLLLRAVADGGTIQMVCGGNNERLRIDSSGNITAVNTASGGQSVTLSVGASNASGMNDGIIKIVNGGTGNGVIQWDYEGNANRAQIYVYRSTQDLIFTTAGTERLRITSAGRTELRKDSECLRLMPTTSGNAVYMEFYDDGNSSRQGFFGFGSNTETSSTMHMHNNRNGHLEFRTNNTVHFRINHNGDLQGTDTSISSLSDSRLKKNVADFVYDLSKFKQFKPKTFEWINTDKHNSGTQRGFLAQDLEGVDAELTGEASLDAELQSSDITTLGGSDKAKTARLGKNDTIYVSVIQQLITKIETLEAKVAALEGS